MKQYLNIFTFSDVKPLSRHVFKGDTLETVKLVTVLVVV